jgi:hypothetical protein
MLCRAEAAAFGDNVGDASDEDAQVRGKSVSRRRMCRAEGRGATSKSSGAPTALGCARDRTRGWGLVFLRRLWRGPVGRQGLKAGATFKFSGALRGKENCAMAVKAVPSMYAGHSLLCLAKMPGTAFAKRQSGDLLSRGRRNAALKAGDTCGSWEQRLPG